MLEIDVCDPVARTQVRRDGQVVPPSEWGKPVAVDPGAVEIEVTAPGHLTHRERVEVPADAGRASVRVPRLRPDRKSAAAASAVPAASGQATSPAPAGRADSSGAGPSRAVGFALAGVGVAATGLGAYFGLRALSKNADSKDLCNASNVCSAQGGQLRDEAKSAALVSTIGIGVGLAAVATGVVLLLAGPGAGPEASAAPAVRVTGHAAPGGGFLGLGGRFW
jgi:hypothetical protein